MLYGMSSANDQTRYRVFRMGGHPVFAVPADSKSARLAGIARYQPISLKRSLYRKAMRAAITTGIDRFLSDTVHNPIINQPCFDFASWMNSVQSTLGVGEVSGAVFWPPQIDRGRVYVHVLNANHQPVGFAKISFDEHNDQCLDNEARVLQHLSNMDHRQYRVPRVIDYRPAAQDRHAVLLTESIPADAHPLEPSQSSFPARCVRAIAGQPYPMGTDDCSTLSWWAAYMERCGAFNAAFTDELAAASTMESRLCRTHGDFGFANIVRDSSDDLWVFDWEESCPDGPVLADEMSFFLAVHRPRSKADHQNLITLFNEHFFADKNPQRRTDVMLALAFRSTVQPLDAGLIVSRWDQFYKGPQS